MLKKIIASLLVICLMPAQIACFPVKAYAAPSQGGLSVSAKSAVLINGDSGEILYAKDENTRRPMASTTKIMTALLTLEAAAKENKNVTITDQMVRVEGSSMGLLPGYKLTLHDLAAGMLTVSGNDAANSAAIAISGSTKEFAKLMNEKAKELELTNTHFVTPSGLDSEEHYTTALDLGRLGAAAIKNSDFLEICSQRQYSVKYQYPQHTARYTNHNKLLSMYQGCIGVKTGFTKKSGRCLVSAAERDGVRLVAVTLSAPDDWNDHVRMLDYGFSQLASFQPGGQGESWTMSVAGGVRDRLLLAAGEAKSVVVNAADLDKIEKTVELPRFVYAPVKEGQLLGTVSYTLNGKTITETPILATEGVERPEITKNIFQKILDGIKSLFQ